MANNSDPDTEKEREIWTDLKPSAKCVVAVEAVADAEECIGDHDRKTTVED